MTKIMEFVAELMELSARTAPKAAGKDFLNLKVVSGAELEQLADDMVKYGVESGKEQGFKRDGENVRNSDALLLIALNDAKDTGLNCGACGFDRCAELEQGAHKGVEFDGPWCAWRLMDLGIALGSAAKTAGMHNADNRIMYRAGVSAKRMGMIEGQVAVGIPLSASGKSIFFDR